MSQRQWEKAENLELLERYEMALRFHGKEESAERVLIERLNLRTLLLTELRAESPCGCLACHRRRD